MTDLWLIQHRDKIVIVPNNERGKDFIKDKMTYSAYGTATFINADVLEDFIKELNKANVTYEER